MHKIDRRVVELVDRLVAEQGDYFPIELLLQSGRLRYPDYEAWRAGQHKDLASQLIGDPDVILNLLQEAAQWAIRLGYDKVTEDTHSRLVTASGQRLHYCLEMSEFNDLLNVHYSRNRAKSPQLDLFFDNQSVTLANEFRSAIVQKNCQQAEGYLIQLEQLDPNNEFCGPAAQLLEAMSRLVKAPDIVEPQREHDFITCELLSLAQKHLASEYRRYMAPFWQRLAANQQAAEYEEARDHHHPSWALFQCLDWPAVVEKIHSYSSYDEQPILVHRLMLAYQNMGQRLDALLALCKLCWSHPNVALTHLEDFPPHDRRFHDALQDWLDEEFDQRWGMALFPSYLIVLEPGLAHACDWQSQSVPAYFILLSRLLRESKRTPEQEIERRLSLQREDPASLDLYIFMKDR